MSRLAATLVVLCVCIVLGPSVALACCADFDTRRPIGWSTTGELLLTRAYATDCEGSNTAETVAPYSRRPRARYDLYAGGRALRGRATVLSITEVWDAFDDNDGEDPFEVPTALARRFSAPVTTLCADAVISRAGAAPSREDEYGPRRRTRITVSIRVGAAFEPVVDDLVVDAFVAQHAVVLVHPSPDGRHGLVRLSMDGPDVSTDELRWFALPEGAAAPEADCDRGSSVYPDPELDAVSALGHTDSDEAWRRRVMRSLATARKGTVPDVVQGALDEAHYGLKELLWADPTDGLLRLSLATALELSGLPDAAAEQVSLLSDVELEMNDPLHVVTEQPETREVDGAIEWPPLLEGATTACVDGGCPMPGAPGAPHPEPMAPLPACAVQRASSSQGEPGALLLTAFCVLAVCLCRRRR